MEGEAGKLSFFSACAWASSTSVTRTKSNECEYRSRRAGNNGAITCALHNWLACWTERSPSSGRTSELIRLTHVALDQDGSVRGQLRSSVGHYQRLPGHEISRPELVSV